ncbi:MbtH family protein [Streptomyces sp. NBC_00258]|uniref:MbtH family protein n=1 Tax=Streptomyces sp. NBC_00258 TaxID=2903642 RepID=UPI002E291F09|nr:MbtH family NRPS accessory protein [Streptomyces sp. NBC_00258]
MTRNEPPAEAPEGPRNDQYRVVVNHEEQYSIWRADQDIPAGWTPVGEPDSQERCLAAVDDLWTDMRPLTLREASGG